MKTMKETIQAANNEFLTEEEMTHRYSKPVQPKIKLDLTASRDSLAETLTGKKISYWPVKPDKLKKTGYRHFQINKVLNVWFAQTTQKHVFTAEVEDLDEKTPKILTFRFDGVVKVSN